MAFCKHCEKELSADTKEHYCSKKRGLLRVDEDDSFLVSTLIGYVTGSSIVGGLLGGDIVGGFLGDIFEGDDDSWF